MIAKESRIFIIKFLRQMEETIEKKIIKIKANNFLCLQGKGFRSATNTIYYEKSPLEEIERNYIKFFP